MPANLGLKHGYPHIPLSTKTRAYIAMARPMTWIAPIIGSVIGIMLSIKYGAASPQDILQDWRTGLHAITTLLLIVIGGNFINNAWDAEADKITKPYRPIPQGLVTTDEANTIGHLTWFLAFARATTINIPFAILTTILIITSYLYSAGPIRTKAHPWLGNLTVAIPRGLLGILTAWTTYANPWHLAPWIIGSILLLFLTGATTTKDFLDATGDRIQGVRTLVVTYGPKKAAKLSIPFILSPILTIPLADILHLLKPMPTIWYIASSLACCLLAYETYNNPHRRAGPAENNAAWAGMYATLLLLMISFLA